MSQTLKERFRFVLFGLRAAFRHRSTVTIRRSLRRVLKRTESRGSTMSKSFGVCAFPRSRFSTICLQKHGCEPVSPARFHLRCARWHSSLPVILPITLQFYANATCKSAFGIESDEQHNTK